VLHDYRGSPEPKMTGLVRDKLLAGKALFNVAQFREPGGGKPSDIEDLFPVGLYLDYFNAAFAKQLGAATIKEADLPAGDRIVQRLVAHLRDQGITLRPSGGFNHYTVAARFAASPPAALDAETAARFRALFAAVNGVL